MNTTKLPVINIHDATLAPAPTASWFDMTALGNWLEPFKRKSPHTHRAYRRAAVYWLYFLEQVHGHHQDLLLRADPVDAHAFLQALTHEFEGDFDSAVIHQSGTLVSVDTTTTPFWRHTDEAAANHVGLKHNPFQQAKSSRSVVQIIAALSSLYKFNNTKRSARDDALLDFNPFADLSRFLLKQNGKTDRLFEPTAYQHMLDTTNVLYQQADSDTHRQRAQRLRWITVALFNLWIRISELASLRMTDFKLRAGMWFVSIQGKGRKIRVLEVTPAVMQELMRYRQTLGLSPLPLRTETDIPAVVALRRRDNTWGRNMTARALFGEVKFLGACSADILEEQLTSNDDPVTAQALIDKLRQMSPHWFRHSGASEAINAEFSIADASERLGHKDPSITVSMYYHGDAKRRMGALEGLEKSRNLTEKIKSS